MNWLRGPLGNVRIVLLLIACLGILIGTHGWQIHERFQYIKTGFHSTQATVELLEFDQSLVLFLVPNIDLRPYREPWIRSPTAPSSPKIFQVRPASIVVQSPLNK